MRRVLVFHRDHCLACRSCELACSVAHSESGALESAIAEEFPVFSAQTAAASVI